MHEQVLGQRLSESYGLDTRPLAGPIRELIACRSRERGLPPGHVVSELLGSGADQWNRVLDGLFLGHTRFYRHPRVWEYLAGTVKEFSSPVRALVAGCSTGQEAVTLGLMLDASLPGRPFEIVAVDANEAALDRARRGAYSVAETGPLPASWVKKGFDLRPNHTAEVAPWLADRIRYSWANLVLGIPPGPFHLVLLRNVLTYMLPAAVDAVLGHVANALASDGLLVIAPQETHLLNRFGLSEAVAPGLPIYRMKRAAPQPHARPSPTSFAPPRNAASPAAPAAAVSVPVALLETGVPRVCSTHQNLSLRDVSWTQLEETLLAHLKSPPPELAMDLGSVQFMESSVQVRFQALCTLLTVSGTKLRWDSNPGGWNSASVRDRNPREPGENADG